MRRDLPERQPLDTEIYGGPLTAEGQGQAHIQMQPSLEMEKERARIALENAASTSKGALKSEHPNGTGSDTSSVILEQAWIMKMADEIARRVYDEKLKSKDTPWTEREDIPPPAYQATQ